MLNVVITLEFVQTFAVPTVFGTVLSKSKYRENHSRCTTPMHRATRRMVLAFTRACFLTRAQRLCFWEALALLPLTLGGLGLTAIDSVRIGY